MIGRIAEDGSFESQRVTPFFDSVVVSYRVDETSGVFWLSDAMAMAVVELAGLRREGLQMSGRTKVDLLWIEDRIKRWIHFGRIIQETIHSRSWRTIGFDPDAIFVFVQWS